MSRKEVTTFTMGFPPHTHTQFDHYMMLPLYGILDFHPWNKCDQRCHVQFLELFPSAVGHAASPKSAKRK